ncbi:hypothetical protein ACFYXX_33510 [Streptomyces sp. NPDC002458]|uniref:hypothetical protein n=1 Tax=Streptomyces sp. NPDC002458 TaxID=3364644 RepID=UPI0036AFBB9E
MSELRHGEPGSSPRPRPPRRRTSYAGPVYISGKGSCIDWSGAIGPAPKQYVIRYATNCG